MVTPDCFETAGTEREVVNDCVASQTESRIVVAIHFVRVFSEKRGDVYYWLIVCRLSARYWIEFQLDVGTA